MYSCTNVERQQQIGSKGVFFHVNCAHGILISYMCCAGQGTSSNDPRRTASTTWTIGIPATRKALGTHSNRTSSWVKYLVLDSKNKETKHGMSRVIGRVIRPTPWEVHRFVRSANLSYVFLFFFFQSRLFRTVPNHVHRNQISDHAILYIISEGVRVGGAGMPQGSALSAQRLEFESLSAHTHHGF
ncbi:hypothetical protein BDN67DRAFT_698365 [Paxillus ammoniavirescens]|nr:hypothetical protein BDN67DRAFT_698365 [Paxillus ammoniavirescens]